jgi:polyisoprenoid-binding protein YceI
MQTATQRGLAPVTFLIDKAASRFTVQTFATGILSSFGHNPTIGIRDYEGEIQFIPETYEKAFLRMTLKNTGLDVLDEMKSVDREKLEKIMYEQVLDVEHFPTTVYESKEIGVEKPGNGPILARATGDLSFHGVTQSLALVARVLDMGSMLRISGDFAVRQSDFGIKPVSFAGGTLRLKDEVKLKFELVARRQEEPIVNERSQ